MFCIFLFCSVLFHSYPANTILSGILKATGDTVGAVDDTQSQMEGLTSAGRAQVLPVLMSQEDKGLQG